jgi:hypothetical protein
MRAGIGIERIAGDVASALASGVTSSPALFVGGERWEGELDTDAVSAALEAAADAKRSTTGPRAAATPRST